VLKKFPQLVWKLAAWLIAGAVSLWTLLPVWQAVILKGNLPSLASRRFDVGLALAIALGIAWLAWLWSILSPAAPVNRAALRTLDWLDRSPVALRGLFALLAASIPVIVFLYPPLGVEPWGFAFRLYLLTLTGALAGMLAAPALARRSPWLTWVCGMLAAGALFTAFKWFNQVTEYPFSLGWSEGNRFWDYSTLFGADRYLLAAGEALKPAITAGRQLLWALPFLLPNLTIGGMRLWDALLWVVPGLLLGWTAFGSTDGRRFSLLRLGFALWAFVFLAQGPIYAPLVVAAILTAWAVQIRRLWLAVLLVILAAYFADISRWTWMYGPGLWAGMLALLDIAQPSLARGKWQPLLRPVALGVAGYFGAAVLPDIIKWLGSGFTTAITPDFISLPGANSLSAQQPLLWARLFPNPTYPTGVLLGLIWAALPLIILLVWLAATKRWQVNALQALAAVGVAGVFLAGGLVVSMKIGGGSNLHNLDLFWITLALIASRAVKGWLADGATAWRSPAALILLVLAVAGPLAFSLQYGRPLEVPPAQVTADALAKVQELVAKYSPRGEVLFIDQRQLLTFRQVQGVPLVASYEKKYMMDMAMAERSSYFEVFNNDLASRRFALIVVEVLHEKERSTSEDNFAEENNAWVRWVSQPILTYYEPVWTIEEVNLQLLVPKK
jgi:hypothetical protein